MEIFKNVQHRYNISHYCYEYKITEMHIQYKLTIVQIK